MSWFNSGSPAPQNSAPPNVIGHTFDVPAQLRVPPNRQPVAATILHIAVAGARLRSWVLLERGTPVSFDWPLENGKPLTLRGAVAARYAPRNGAVGFEYAIALEALPEEDEDALARQAAMLARRTAAARNYDTSLVDISQFTGYRVADDFALGYRSDDPQGTPRVGRACDITGNGLRMRCDERLRQGQMLLLQFTLPDHVLRVHEGKDDELVAAPFGYRQILRKYLRRPFAPLKMRAKVLGTVKDSARRDAYEVAFIDVAGTQREELARYIHASQLSRRKR